MWIKLVLTLVSAHRRGMGGGEGLSSSKLMLACGEGRSSKTRLSVDWNGIRLTLTRYTSIDIHGDTAAIEAVE